MSTIAAKPTPEAAVLGFTSLSFTGTGMLIAAIISGFLMGFSRQLFRRRHGQDDRRAIDRRRRDQLVRPRRLDPALCVSAFDRAGLPRRRAGDYVHPFTMLVLK
jgi:hypothetical protein